MALKNQKVFGTASSCKLSVCLSLSSNCLSDWFTSLFTPKDMKDNERSQDLGCVWIEEFVGKGKAVPYLDS